MKAKPSYNAVGAGATPKLGYCKSVMNEVRPGGGQDFSPVKVSTDTPKSAPSSGYGKKMGSAAGMPPKAARPGGPQGI
jgi:hypothetical protein